MTKLIRWFDRVTGAERRTFNRVIHLANGIYHKGHYCGDANDLIKAVYREYWK